MGTINVVKSIKMVYPTCMVLVKIGTFYDVYSKDVYIISYLLKYKIKESKEDKKQVEGQIDLYNLQFADIAHELDKVNLNELTPIDALNILAKLKGKIAG